jgi:hypothetical protein
MSLKHGFTLLEMSVELLIIALIIGAITIGNTLIKNAELETVISNVSRFKNAAKMFQDKYHYLPGDIPNATAFWGTDAACPAGAASDAAKIATCNGDGNGMIGGPTAGANFPSPSYMGSHYQEQTRVWQHLSNAGLIPGAYSGVDYHQAGMLYHTDVNTPASHTTDGAGYLFFYSSTLTDDGTGIGRTPDGAAQAAYPGAYGHVIVYLQANLIAAGDKLDTPILSPKNAESIDQKIDDGMPSTGNVVTFGTLSTNSGRCANNSSPVPFYQTQLSGYLCALIFTTGL